MFTSEKSSPGSGKNFEMASGNGISGLLNVKIFWGKKAPRSPWRLAPVACVSCASLHTNF